MAKFDHKTEFRGPQIYTLCICQYISYSFWILVSCSQAQTDNSLILKYSGQNLIQPPLFKDKGFESHY